MTREPLLVLKSEEYLLPEVFPVVDGRRLSQITITRATTATYYDYAGILRTLSSGQPRNKHYFQDGSGDYGIFIEGASTNVCLQSEDLSTTWTVNNSSITTNASIGPDLQTTSDIIVVDTATDVHNIEQTFTGSTSNDFCASVFAKEGTTTNLQLRVSDTTDTDYIEIIVDLSDGSVAQAAAATGANATLTGSGVETLPNGWYRVWISGICDSTTTAHKIVLGIPDGTTLSYTGNGTDYMSLFGVQLEEASIPSSYIATTTTSETRDADEFLLDLSAYSWFNNTEGTVLIDFKRYGEVDNTKSMIIQLDDADVDNSISLFQSATSKQITYEVTDATVSQVSDNTSTGDSNIRAKVAFAYKANDFAVSVNGAAATTDSSGTVPTGIVNMRIGYDETGRQLNGIIKDIVYYDTRLSDANLAIITT